MADRRLFSQGSALRVGVTVLALVYATLLAVPLVMLINARTLQHSMVNIAAGEDRWMLYRAEFEYQAVITALERAQAGDPGIGRVQVQTAIDVLFSRNDSLKSARSSPIFAALTDRHQATVESIDAAIAAADQILGREAGPRLSPDGVRELSGAFMRIGQPLATLVRDARTASVKLRDKLLDKATSMTGWLLAAVAALGLASLGLVSVLAWNNRRLLVATTELQTTVKALRDSDERLRFAQGAGRIASWIWDAGDALPRYSGPFEEIIGVAPGTFPGALSDFLQLVHPDDREHTRRALNDCLKGASAEFAIQTRVLGDDGKLRWLEIIGRNLQAANGRTQRMAGVIHEISERKRGEAERLTLASQLRESQKMEAIGELTGGIAHDFNNQLGVIMGNLALLKECAANDPRAPEYIEAALYAAKHSAELTRSLLAFARRQPLRPKIVDIGDFITESVRLIDRTLGEDIEVKLSRLPGETPVLVDTAQLSACIINLANNARDAMPEGGALTISVRTVELGQDYAALHPEVDAGDYVAIEVSDTGIGMTPEAAGKAFEPFFTTKEIGKGTGLGLSMVHGFVKQSSGHVEIVSELGRGTTVRIYLPRVTERRAAMASVPLTSEPVRMPRGKETVLMVEDNESVRKTVAAQLTSLGYHVLEAAKGWEALAILDRSGQGIDLLFTDIVMPGGMDGYALARAAAERRPNLKVLLTSGFPGRWSERAGDRRSDHHLLSKPYSQDDLAKAVWAALHRA